MSRDLNIERSSTKLHAPPGGKSTFSIGGDYSSDAVKPPAAKKAAPPVVEAPAAVARSTPSKGPANSMDSLISQESTQQVQSHFRTHLLLPFIRSPLRPTHTARAPRETGSRRSLLHRHRLNVAPVVAPVPHCLCCQNLYTHLLSHGIKPRIPD